MLQYLVHDTRVKLKTTESWTSIYRDLQIAIQRLWNVTVIVVPIIIGALGSIPHDLLLWLRKLDFEDRMIPLFQKTVLLGTFYILRH